MQLKLLHSIVTQRGQFLPPKVVSIADMGISPEEARVLVRRGFAEDYNPEAAPAELVAPVGGPEVTNVQTIVSTDADGQPGADLVEGTLAGVVGDDGKAVDLDDMRKAELVELAAGMGIDTDGKTKAELIADIKATPVFADKGDIVDGGEAAEAQG